MRVEYIPDNKNDISQSILRMRQRVGENGFVFTSGGIGPTHDDVTYEAIAAAFGVTPMPSMQLCIQCTPSCEATWGVCAFAVLKTLSLLHPGHTIIVAWPHKIFNIGSDVHNIGTDVHEGYIAKKCTICRC